MASFMLLGRDTSFTRTVDSYFFYPFYKNLSDLSQNSPCLVSCAAPFISISDATASTIQAIGGIFEATVKLIILVFRKMYHTKENEICLLITIVVLTGVNTIVCAFGIFAKTLLITYKMIKDPQKTSEVFSSQYRQAIELAAQEPPLIDR